MNINLHIERLVLDGVNIAPHQRLLLREALQAELTRLLSTGGLSEGLTRGITLPKISANGVQLTSNDPTQLGQQIAQSVYGGIGHE